MTVSASVIPTIHGESKDRSASERVFDRIVRRCFSTHVSACLGRGRRRELRDAFNLLRSVVSDVAT